MRRVFASRRRARAAHAAIRMLMPYFGTWPEWFELYLETCRRNPSIEWLFWTDCPPVRSPPRNVRFESMSFEQFGSLVRRQLRIDLPLSGPYKICDLRPAFGRIFADHLSGCDFFGWGDIDVVYGRLEALLTPEMLAHDVVAFNDEHLTGHFTLVRNAPRHLDLHDHFPDWHEKIFLPPYSGLDEPHPAQLPGWLSVYSRESFNTPLSPLIAWRDGRHVFPREWTWRDGRLTNDLDAGVEFLYLHFMHWKGGDWPRECGNAQWETLPRLVHFDPRDVARGFRVNAGGFFPLALPAPNRSSFLEPLLRHFR